MFVIYICIHGVYFSIRGRFILQNIENLSNICIIIVFKYVCCEEYVMYVYGNPSGRARESALIRANWESDIDEVILEPCEQDEDPSGYRVIFYKDPMGKYGKNGGCTYLA